MSVENPLTRKRVSILHRYFKQACDHTHPFQIDDLRKLRLRFATNAAVLKPTEEGTQFQHLVSICGQLPAEKLAAMYERRFEPREMVQIAFPDRPRLFN